MDRFDAIVVGLGAMGASAVASLAARGASVLGIDRFPFGHGQGSTHGESRLTRLAYFEHPDYVPLLKKSHQLWRRLENASSRLIFEETGLLYFGRASSRVLGGVRKSAELYQIPISNLTPQQVTQAYSAFSLEGDWQAIFESSAGYLRIDEALAAFTDGAEKGGARFLREEAVIEWMAKDGGYEVQTERNRYWAKHLVLTMGPWNQSPLLKWTLPLTVRRQTQFWFTPRAKQSPPSYPCFAFDFGDAFVYGFPPIDGRTKIANHALGEIVSDADIVNRMVGSAESAKVSKTLESAVTWLNPTPIKASVCLYTMTPDGNFIIDHHPNFPNVVVAAGFSGHGFKFAPVVGEAISDLTLNGKTDYPISFLSGGRFGK